MTNYEKYKDEIISIILESVGVSKENGKPIECTSLSCKNCMFGYSECRNHMARWLDAEWEPPKDTIEVSTLISFLKQEPNQMKHVKSIKIVDGMPVINGGE